MGPRFDSVGETAFCGNPPSTNVVSGVDSGVEQSRESVFGDQLSVIGKLKGYGPPLGWWQMVPYFHMAEQYDFAKEHPETNAPTVHDQQQAISVLSGSTRDD